MIHLLRSPATTEQLTEMLEIRPGQNNPAMEIISPAIRESVNVIVRRFFEGV